MSAKEAANIPASVRQRLLNRARSERRPFNELLQYYAMERFLYPLSQSPHADGFILKGALMLRVWHSAEFRQTMDIDMLGITSNEVANIVAQLRDILAVEVPPEGLVFIRDSLQAERITEDSGYEGIRIRFQGTLDSAKVHMQIDIGFGDVVFPGPEDYDFPAILDFPPPRLRCYSRESTIAEKFEAMVKLHEMNSRMKDFYDIWLLSRQFDFVGEKLVEAIRLTFNRHGTKLPNEIVAFTERFIDTKQIQWKTFTRKLNQEYIPTSFANIVSAVKSFLGPLATAISSGTSVPTIWVAPTILYFKLGIRPWLGMFEVAILSAGLGAAIGLICYRSGLPYLSFAIICLGFTRIVVFIAFAWDITEWGALVGLSFSCPLVRSCASIFVSAYT